MNETNVRSNAGVKERILDAAERLFCDSGIDGASLRQITALADVNLAAVNYHFQTKDELVRAVYSRRLRPINEERIALLDALEREHGDNPVPLDSLLHAFYAPGFVAISRLAGLGVTFTKMMGRIYTDPNPGVDRIFSEEIAPVAARFNRAFGKALPHLTQKEVFWRMYLSVGLLAHLLGSSRKITLISGNICDGDNLQEALLQVKAFAKAGLCAPSAEKPAEEQS
jgi:AcrR family transcriptional regulator